MHVNNDNAHLMLLLTTCGALYGLNFRRGQINTSCHVI